MVQRFLPLLPAVLLGFLFADHGGAQDCKVSVAGIQVVRFAIPADNSADPFSVGNPRNPFGANHNGTDVVLMIESPERNILSMDYTQSKIEHFSDSAGESLLESRSIDVDDANSNSNPFAPQKRRKGLSRIRIDPKQHRALVSIFGPSTPSRGCQFLEISGSLALRTASETTLLRSKTVAVGTKTAKVGEMEIDLNYDATPTESDNQFKLSLTTKDRRIDLAKDVRFLIDGSDVDSKRTGRSTRATGRELTQTLKYQLSRAPKNSIEIQIELWADQRIDIVPFDLTFGLDGESL